ASTSRTQASCRPTTWGAYRAISAARSTLAVSQGLHRFHVMTRFGTVSRPSGADGWPAKRLPPGALGPASTAQARITPPANHRVPLPSTVASSVRTTVADSIVPHGAG